MAVRGGGASVGAAIAAAGAAGAAQLGLAYGLGVMLWLPSTDGAGESAWVASLGWALWISATSTVAGAVCADWLSSPPGTGREGRRWLAPTRLASALGRTALAVAAAIGASVTVVLVAVPARAATRADTFSPQTIAAGYAVLGVLLGLLMAIWAVSSRPVARNVMATVAWLWLLAVGAVIDGVVSGQGFTAAQLGVWQISSDSDRYWFRDYFYWPGAVVSLGSALLIGALAARSAARQPQARVAAAISGGAGPLLVAAAYFLAAPRLVGVRAEQLSAHLMAPYAVVAGVAGSAIAAALAQRAATDESVDPAGPRRGANLRPVPRVRPGQATTGVGQSVTGRDPAPGGAVPPRSQPDAGRAAVPPPSRPIPADGTRPTTPRSAS